MYFFHWFRLFLLPITSTFYYNKFFLLEIYSFWVDYQHLWKKYLFGKVLLVSSILWTCFTAVLRVFFRFQVLIILIKPNIANKLCEAPKNNHSKSNSWIILLRDIVFVLVILEHSFTGSILTKVVLVK